MLLKQRCSLALATAQQGKSASRPNKRVELTKVWNKKWGQNIYGIKLELFIPWGFQILIAEKHWIFQNIIETDFVQARFSQSMGFLGSLNAVSKRFWPLCENAMIVRKMCWFVTHSLSVIQLLVWRKLFSSTEEGW